MSAAGAALVLTACSDLARPTAPGSALTDTQGRSASHQAGVASAHEHLDGDKGYIDGWFNGETVQLHYTKAFFCEEPPASGAEDSECEVGADAEVAPRPGPIPTIFAIAWTAGFPFPDLSTFSCGPGTVCLNHPAHIDVSRVVPGRSNAPALPHSHIVTEHHGGWFNTMNIRVSNLAAWNQIAAAKTLTKVRELQAAGLASADTPTNIYFFIASWH
jgi:hypothetical protein